LAQPLTTLATDATEASSIAIIGNTATQLR
jgi:hypothetical protein